ncbi:restriction endonuclease subunit S [Salinicoccus roseus]|uniref:restriction endonuclease subunit S n=1 Tax=Salinicoccus roseus TaxID=45670 RepID=UPI002300D555|nr:restriction endonuclease subunit S [Salinicoccus roseus]
MSKLKEYRISELGEIGRGRSRHRPRNDKALYGGEYPFIQTGDVKRANFYITEHTATYNEVGLAQSKMWEEDTLCITIAANIADTAILKYPACFPDSIIGFQPYKDKSDVRFIKYYFDIYKKHMESISMGATQSNLSVAKLESLTFRVPSIKVQKKIANVLSTYDKLIENNNRRIEVLEQTTEEIYKEWFVRMRFPGYENTKFVKGIPEGWKVLKLQDFSEINYGKQLPTNKLIHKGYEVFGGNGIIGYYHEYMYEEQKILISCRGAASGEIVVSNPNSFITNNSLILNLSDELFEYMKQNLFNSNLKPYATGSAQPQITINNIKGIKFLIPNHGILSKYNNLMKEVNSKTLYLSKQNKNLKKQRDLLLPRLMNGTIEVK